MINKISPKISVLMPAYNAEKYISEAIESILNQTYKNIELIVIDDNSTDNTRAIIKEFSLTDKRVKFYFNKKNIKMSRTLNKAISLSKGKYLARLDSDDISYIDRIKKQVEYMEQNPSVVILGGTMKIISSTGEILGCRSYPLTDREIRKKMFRYSPFSHPTIMIRRKELVEIGGYDMKYDYAEDYDMYFRIARKGKLANLNDVLIKYRKLPNSISYSKTKKLELITISIRKKYAKEYKMGILDKFYTYLHLLSIYTSPFQWRLKVFSYFRDTI